MWYLASTGQKYAALALRHDAVGAGGALSSSLRASVCTAILHGHARPRMRKGSAQQCHTHAVWRAVAAALILFSLSLLTIPPLYFLPQFADMLSLTSASMSYAGAMPAMPVVQRAAAPSMGLSWTTPGEGAVWDPLGITKDAAKFEKFRYAEVKHGRVAMLAVVGHITAASGARFGGELANGVKFTSIEGTGYKALSQVRAER